MGGDFGGYNLATHLATHGYLRPILKYLISFCKF
jgi:hypothetical protein